MDSGYIKLWRKKINWCWFKYSETSHLFEYLLIRATYKPIQIGHTKLEAGQLIFGSHQASFYTGLSRQSVRTSLERLKSTNDITIKSTNRFSIITICNYSLYQSNEDAINQQINQPANQPTTSKQPANNHIQEVKHLRSKELNPLVGEFLSYFNLKAKKSLSLTDARRKIIESRLEIYSINQLKQAVDNFVRDEWEGRHKFMDIVYCIGTRSGVDNLDRWLNQEKKTMWVKP